jgi:urease accessory protein
MTALRLRPALCALASTLVSTPVQAHLVSTGLGPFYDGIGHFFLGLETWLPLLALCLLAAQHSAALARATLLSVPIAWLSGALIASAFPLAAALGSAPLMSATLMLLCGVIAAIAPALSRVTLIALAVSLGLLLGAGDGAGLGARTGVVSLLAGNGLALCVFVFMTLGTALAFFRGPPWRRIAARALSSWIGAAGLLMLGWQLRGG